MEGRWNAMGRRAFALVLGVAAPFLLTGCGSTCGDVPQGCDAKRGCDYTVQIKAAMPPIDQEIWTVKGCLGASCESGEVDASSLGMSLAVLDVEVVQASDGSWELDCSLRDSKSREGDTWSLLVTGSQGKVITRGNGTVHYAPHSYCPKQEVVLP